MAVPLAETQDIAGLERGSRAKPDFFAGAHLSAGADLSMQVHGTQGGSAVVDRRWRPQMSFDGDQEAEVK